MKWEIIIPVVIAIATPLFILAYSKKKDFGKIWPFIYYSLWLLIIVINVWSLAINIYYSNLSENYKPALGNSELYFETIKKAKTSSEILAGWEGLFIGLSYAIIVILLGITYKNLNTEDSDI